MRTHKIGLAWIDVLSCPQQVRPRKGGGRELETISAKRCGGRLALPLHLRVCAQSGVEREALQDCRQSQQRYRIRAPRPRAALSSHIQNRLHAQLRAEARQVRRRCRLISLQHFEFSSLLTSKARSAERRLCIPFETG